MEKVNFTISVLCLALFGTAALQTVKLEEAREELHHTQRAEQLWKQDALVNSQAVDAMNQLVAAMKDQQHALVKFHEAEMARERFYRTYLVDTKVQEVLAARKAGLHLTVSSQ